MLRTNSWPWWFLPAFAALLGIGSLVTSHIAEGGFAVDR
jgi:hypothetical protein